MRNLQQITLKMFYILNLIKKLKNNINYLLILVLSKAKT